MTCRTEDVAARLEPVARRALRECGVSATRRELTLLNVSENATYAVDDPASGERTVLRVHRHGYHDAAEIESELAWLEALREQAGVRTPRVLRTGDGRRLLALDEAGAPDPRYVVHFEWLPGDEPTPTDERLPASFELLGAITARMHDHVATWRHLRASPASPGTTTARSARSRAGGAGRTVSRSATRSARCSDDSTTRCASGSRASGPGRSRYGLVHADLRLANLLVDGDQTYVIDFDDCGWSWFLYDFGAAVSFFEHDPRIPELTDAWVRGYRSVRSLPAEDEAEIDTFVLMRRLLLVAWIGSHSGTDLARSMGAEYTAGSCELAEAYLSRFG